MHNYTTCREELGREHLKAEARVVKFAEKMAKQSAVLRGVLTATKASLCQLSRAEMRK